MSLLVVNTHPVQYHAPVYRAIQQEFGIPVTVMYGSDFSIAGYRDREFQTEFAWDTPLVQETDQLFFLSRVAQGGARDFEEVSARGMAEAFNKIPAEAVLINGYAPAFHRAAFWQAYRRRMPILFRAETMDPPETSWRSHARSALLRLFYGCCQRVLPIGKLSRQHYAARGVPASKMVFSPYCVDSSTFHLEEASRRQLRQATRQAEGISESAVVILFSGKLNQRKDPVRIVEAVRLLPEAMRRQAVVTFLGEGAERAALEAAARREPTVQIRLLGFKNQRDLSAYYHAADVLVLPSLQETWGLVVNEALHHGLPCIVSDCVGSGPDLVEQDVTGGVAKAGDAASFAHQLERLWQPIAQGTMADACRQVVSGYTVEAAAQGIALAYRQVVDN
jgi:glycosyltransferase involved in cell wall biosynthesis